MMKKILALYIFSLLICDHSVFIQAQGKKIEVFPVAFYNLENLFDTEDDLENKGDDEFLPSGTYNWTLDKYHKKLDNLAFVINRLAKEHSPLGASIIGVAEVENRKVLEDLVARPSIAGMGLKIVHRDSPDRRGIDVAFLYNPDLFTLLSYSVHPYYFEKNPSYVSRDQLLVSGILGGDTIHVSVNHWPSRYGAKSSELREAAARGVKQVADSLYRLNKNAKIIIMGDLNDEPTNRSTRLVLNAQKNRVDVKPGGLFNPMWKLYDRGIGSLAYQGKWSLFDQIIISYPFLENGGVGLHYWKTEIYNRNFLIQQEGPDKGYPHRTFSNSTFINGYSDHLPTIVYLIRDK